MGWNLEKTRRVWQCTEYADLQFAEIENFAEYGQPRSPYEPGFISEETSIPDFKNVIIEMPQAEVMKNGYGQNIEATDFPIVNKFLTDTPLALPVGSYTFADLVSKKFATEADRTITDNLYGNLFGKVVAGTISPGDAAVIHGTVCFRLMTSTQFVRTSKNRQVCAEIGAGDDNWDFESSTWKAKLVNPLLAATLVTHYNLEAPVKIKFVGPGKNSCVIRAEPKPPLWGK